MMEEDLGDGECGNCQKMCLPHYKLSHSTYAQRCQRCQRFNCGSCQSICRWNMPHCLLRNYSGAVSLSLYFRIVLYLIKYGDPKELKQLLFDKWSPMWCEKCRIPITPKRQLQLINCDEILCVDCPNAAGFTTDQELRQVEEYTHRIKDLSRSFGYYSTKNCEPFIRKPLELRSALCEGCKTSKQVVCFTEEGLPLCEACAGGKKTFQLWKTESGRFFYDLVAYVPDINDLKLLTYSSWTPLKCETCKIPFSEEAPNMPFFHPDCHKLLCQRCTPKHKCSDRQKPLMVDMKFLVHWILEFRAFFKNGGIDVESHEPHVIQTPIILGALSIPLRSTSLQCEVRDGEESSQSAIRIDKVSKPGERSVFVHTANTAPRNPLASALEESYNTGTLLRGAAFQFPSRMPEAVKCLECDGFEDIAELSTCKTCSVHGVCTRCLKKRHWGHEVEDASDRLRAALVQHNNENTVEKLLRWKGNFDEMLTKRVAMQNKLIDAYIQLHTNAMQNNDTELVQSSLSLANIIQLQDDAMSFITANIRFNSGMEILCDRVTTLADDLTDKEVAK